ncbi:Mads box transcription factor mcm1 [Neofusicoccum parvum]|nr:Mads box transcription factor mcm1 [Neofusicoccum parvum]
MNPKYDTTKISALTDIEKLRLATAYLNHLEPKNVDWETAAAQAGSKSKESYMKMFNATLKKLAAEPGDGGEGAAASAAAPAPKKAAPKKGRKRATSVIEDDEEEGISTTKAKKASKPRGKKSKKDDSMEEECV